MGEAIISCILRGKLRREGSYSGKGMYKIQLRLVLRMYFQQLLSAHPVIPKIVLFTGFHIIVAWQRAFGKGGSWRTPFTGKGFSVGASSVAMKSQNPACKARKEGKKDVKSQHNKLQNTMSCFKPLDNPKQVYHHAF